MRRQGFTMIELLVTMGVVVIFLGLLNELFRDTSNAVGFGAGTSDLIGAERAMSDQIARDAKDMLGPKGNYLDTEGRGFLVIINRALGSAMGPGWVRTVNPRGGEWDCDGDTAAGRPSPVRDDVLLFIRTRPGSAADPGSTPLLPVCPSGDGFLTGMSAAQLADGNRAPYVMVRYGHGFITRPDGTDTPNEQFGSSRALLGTADLGFPNHLANRMVLARHALFLLNRQPPPAWGVTNYVLGLPFATSKPAQPLSGAPMGPGTEGRGALCRGLTDLALQGLLAPAVDNDGGAIAQQKALFGATSTDAWFYDDSTNNSDPTYRSMLDGMALGSDRRIRVNPHPDVLTSGTLQPWQIAQMHAYFAPRVSDFIVEFAADLDGNGQVDVDDASPGYPALVADRFGRPYKYAGGAVKWYSAIGADNDPNKPASFDSLLPPTFASKPWSGTIHNPVMGPQPLGSDYVFAWRHDDDGATYAPTAANPYAINPKRSAWPYLIRLRWRMHDPRGQLVEASPNTAKIGVPNAGKWFEQIIAVPRPR